MLILRFIKIFPIPKSGLTLFLEVNLRITFHGLGAVGAINFLPIQVSKLNGKTNSHGTQCSLPYTRTKKPKNIDPVIPNLSNLAIPNFLCNHKSKRYFNFQKNQLEYHHQPLTI